MSKYTPSPGIYIILNTKNGKIYIGQAEDIHARQVEHKRDLKKNRHHNQHLQHAWNKYGEKAFQFKTLERCSITELDSREQHYLDVYIPKGICYNIAVDATAPMRGLKHSPESLLKMSIVQKSIPHTISPEQRARMAVAQREANKDRIPTQKQREHFLKLNESRKGQKLSEEHRRKISEAGKGRIATEETRRKLSKANKGKTRNDETRRKLSEVAKNRPPTSDETRQKLSVAGKGRTHSEETKKKMSEAAKLRWQRQKEND